MGPSSPEYPINQPKIYALKLPSSFQGIRSTPTIPVMMPPVRNEIRRGFRLEKSFDGETTLAATLVLRVAISSATRATDATTGRWKRPRRMTGSQIALPKITTEADVTATAIRE